MTLERRTELKRGKGLARGTKRLEADPERRREWRRRSAKPLPAKSERRASEKDHRTELVHEQLNAEPRCAAEIPYFCTTWADEVNELKRGGQRATEYLIREHTESLCHNCHQWITVHPDWARRHGHQVTGEADEAEFEAARRIRIRCVGHDVDCTEDHRDAA